MKKYVSFLVAILTLAMLVATSGCAANKSNLSAQEYNQQGLSLANQDKYKDAVASYTRAIQLNSQDAQFYVNRGTAYLNMKEFDLAIADFDQAIELDPNLAEAYAGRGYAYMNKGGVYLNLAIADFNLVLLKSKNADLINYAKKMLENLTKTPPFLAVIPLPPVIDIPPEPIVNNGTKEGNVTPPDLGLPSIKDRVQSSVQISVVLVGRRSNGPTISFGTLDPFVVRAYPLNTIQEVEALGMTSTGIVWQGNSFSVKQEQRFTYPGGATVEVSGTVSDDWRQILNVRVNGYKIVRDNPSGKLGMILEEVTMELSAVNIPLGNEDDTAWRVRGMGYSVSGPQGRGHIVDARFVSFKRWWVDGGTKSVESSFSYSPDDIDWNSSSKPLVQVMFYFAKR